MSGVMGRRSSSSSTLPSTAKRPAARAAENAAATATATKVAAAASGQQAKKRVALGNISNQANNKGAKNVGGRPIGTKGTNKVNAATSTSTVKKGPAASIGGSRLHPNFALASSAVKSNTTFSNESLLPPNNKHTTTLAASLALCSSLKSPAHSADSVSLDETMSTCDSMKSPDIEYIDNGDSSVFPSLERRANDKLCISSNADAAEFNWRKDVPSAMETDDIIDVDTNHEDPQFCTTLARDIYRHLRIAEEEPVTSRFLLTRVDITDKKIDGEWFSQKLKLMEDKPTHIQVLTLPSHTKRRPSTDFMETIQKDVNASMRSILIDWLVEVAEEYRLVPDTLYLTVNYIDRYLSGNEMSRQRLQLLGVACMLIAAKYEEICAPQVEEFCYITDNTYLKDEVIQMEADVLKYLKFEMTAPTAKCFLRRFIRAAQGCTEVSALQLEFLANYLAELSLLEYNLLCYSPSLIAASAIFLAIFILQPAKRPWNATLGHYTLYKPSDLSSCVRALHILFSNSPGNSLPAIREKYSQHKYKFVAKKSCPPLPSEYFLDEV